MSRAATSRLKCNAPLGLRPSLENRTIRELGIDATYQRSIETGPSRALIRRIAQHWDWGLFQPLVVAKRVDGTFWVVDGQHRLAAARLRSDMYDLPCVVTQYDNPGDEAATFVALNVQRRPLSALDLFKAALAANDESSIEIEMMLSAAGLSLAPHSNFTAWKPGMVSNISGIIAAHRIHGKKAAARALRVLARGFDGQVLQYAGTIFPGVVKLIAADARTDDDLLAMVLEGATQKQWCMEIERLKISAGHTRPVASFEVLRGAYAEAADEAEAA